MHELCEVCGEIGGLTSPAAMYIARARLVAIILLVVNFVLTTIICALAGKNMNSFLVHSLPSETDLGTDYGTSDLPSDSFGINYSILELFIVLYSIPAGMVSVTAVITGVHHVRVWNLVTAAAAQATAWISWMFILCAMCIAANENFNPDSIHVKGMQVVYICLIVLTGTHLAYTLALYIPDESLRANLDTPDD